MSMTKINYGSGGPACNTTPVHSSSADDSFLEGYEKGVEEGLARGRHEAVTAGFAVIEGCAARELKALNDWIREPDFAENFSLEDITNWINRRPIGITARLASAPEVSDDRLVQPQSLGCGEP